MFRYFLFLVPALLFTACGGDKKDAQAAPAAAPAPAEPEKVVGIATIEPMNRILPLNADVAGTIAAINVQANQRTAKGQPILTLNSDVEQAQLAQARSRITTQQAVLKTQEATIAALRVKLANAKTTLDRNTRLAAANAQVQSVVDNDRFAVESAEKDIATAEANLSQQRSRLQELEADIRYAETLLNRRQIAAPADGMVLNLDARVGGSVTPGVSVGEFAPDGGIIAVTEVDELFADRIREGQTAFIRAQGGSDRLAGGRIVYLAPYLKKKSLFSDRADNLEDRRVREVHVLLDTGAKILIGSRVECVIQL